MEKSLGRLAALAVVWLTVPQAFAQSFLYVGNAESQNITVLGLDDATGALADIETIAVPGPSKPGGSMPLAVSPDKKFLFAALRNEPFSVVTFAVDPEKGRLTAVGSGPLSASMAYISADRTGRYLLAASYPGDQVTVSPVGWNGVVGTATQIVMTEPKAHAIITDRSNRFAFHTSLGGDVIYQQKFDAGTGSLTANDPPIVKTKAQAGPRKLIFSPDERFLYVLNELDGTIDVLPYDAPSGTLGAEIQIAAIMPPDSKEKPWAADLRLTPNGKYLYASERTTSTIAAFKVDATRGALTPIDNVGTEKQPRAIAIDPSGRYLVAAGELSDMAAIYRIDLATGRLQKIGRAAVGTKPNWIEALAFP